MNLSRQKKVYQLVTTVQWIVIALTLLYTQLPTLAHIYKWVHWILALSVLYALVYSKLPEKIYTHPRFFLWTSFVYQAYIVIMVLGTGGIESDLHWLFLLPILFLASYYGIKEGLRTAVISSILLSLVYLLDIGELGYIPFLHVLARRLSVLMGTGLFVGLFADEEIWERKEIEISHSLSQNFMKEPTIQNILNSTCRKISTVFSPDIYALLLCDSKTNMLIAQQPAIGLTAKQTDALAIPLNSEHPVVEAFEEGKPFISNNALHDPRLDKSMLTNLGLRSILIVSIFSRKKAIGALAIAHTKRRKIFKYPEITLLTTIANQIAIHMERAKLYEQTEHSAEEATLLFKTSKAISSTIDLEILLKLITKNTANLLDADASCLMLLDKQTKELCAKAAYSLKKDKKTGAKSLETNTSISVCEIHTMKMGEGIPGWVAEKEKPLLIYDFQEDLRFKNSLPPCKREIRSAVSVPLVVKNKVIGVLNADSMSPYKFNEGDLKMLSTLSGQVAVAIHNAQLFSQLEDLYIETLKAFIMAIEAKDPYTRGHSEKVTKYALAIGEVLGLSKEENDKLMRASLLHDIGKIGLKEDILLKPAKLSKAEYDIVKKHPSIGVQIVGSIKSLQEIIPIILHHHEHYDGNGYPANLKGENIPPGSRILAVADAFQAMTSDRPYRKALDTKLALKELEKKAGSQFDPQVVQAFLKMMKSPNVEEELRKIEEQFELENSLRAREPDKVL